MDPNEGIGALFPIGGIFAVFLTLRYFVCVARGEARGSWTLPLGTGWLMFACLFVVPPGGTGRPNECAHAALYLNLGLTWAAALLWSYAMLAFVGSEAVWRRRRRNALRRLASWPPEARLRYVPRGAPAA